ncbi:hypothetical protein HanOQP8_Chr01g0031671 [Helianthus annuus]|nr:hypothetical protein HanIR_Chr01g0041951 [Helianthus annuus]KAJ0793647.1 hypothetical protein HanOQP8_Chr01g0031671 [Helianthus annuus]
MHTLQCRTVAKTWRFGPVNQKKTDGSVDRTKTSSFGRVLVLSNRQKTDTRSGCRTKTRQKLGVLVRSTDPSDTHQSLFG